MVQMLGILVTGGATKCYVQLVSGGAVTVVTAAPTFIDITIPEGAELGMQLAQTLSNGKTITFTIPEDKKVGDVIQVPLE